MKDYTFGNDDDFVLCFKKEGDCLIVEYPNKKLSYPYSKNLESKLLDTMKRQSENNYYLFFKVKKLEKSKKYLKLLNFSTLILILTTILTTGFLSSILLSLSIISSVSYSYKLFQVINLNNKVKEVEDDKLKIELYNQNESLINSNIRKKEVYEKVNFNVKKIVDSTIDRKVFDINKIDRLTLEEARQLLELVKQYQDVEEVELSQQFVLGKSDI